jgi:hypothetical protein
MDVQRQSPVDYLPRMPQTFQEPGLETGGYEMNDDIIIQYFKSPPIPYPNPICGLISLPDEVDDARDTLKDRPSVVFKMAAYQMKVIALAERLRKRDLSDYFSNLRKYEAMMRDTLKDSIPLYERVDRALCIYALDSLIRWERERHHY